MTPGPRWTIQKARNEGSTEPYMARLIAGVCDLRDILLQRRANRDNDFDKLRRDFDDLYAPVRDAMDSARNNQKRIVAMVNDHRAKLASGEIVSYQTNALQLSESITLPLQESFSSFLSAAVRATKTLQTLLSSLDVDIACLFVSDSNFAQGIQRLRDAGRGDLADYLKETRTGWSGMLIKRRNAHEHEGWTLPDVSYSKPWITPVEMNEPEVDGMKVTAYVTDMLAHVLMFVEDVITYAVQRGLPQGRAIAEIPPDKRNPIFPKRFYFTVLQLEPDAAVWTLRYSPKGFP